MEKKEQELLAEVFATVAHQWRQPLSKINSLVGAVDNILYTEGIELEEVNKKLAEIEKTTKEMSLIIDDFRGYFSKKREEIVFADVVEMLKQSVGDMLMQNQIDFQTEGEEKTLFYGDEQLLKQVLVTLVHNARDALVARNVYKPKITLSLKEEQKRILLSLCDNAGGISKSRQQRLFEHDFSTKHSSEGSGLGLFMVKKLLREKLNADIDVANVGDGSCFTIRFEDKKDG